MFFINPFIYAGGGDFESIATVTVGSGGASSITFSDIPQTYQHLQIRGIVRENGGNVHIVVARMNNDSTGGRYVQHHLIGTGSATESGAFNNLFFDGGGSTASTFMFGNDNPVDSPAAFVYDILDYSSTTKAKTGRCLFGFDTNGTGNGASQFGFVGVASTLYTQTSAITSLTFIEGGQNFRQHSTFALYGVKAP